MVNGCLHLAGVSESWIQTLLQDPFVDPENHHTAQETAQILLLAQLQDDGGLPDIFTPPSREIYELIISDLTGGAGHYSIDQALTFVIEYATGSFSRLDISGNFPHNSSGLDVPFKLGCDELVRYNMTKKNGGMPIEIGRARSPARNNEESLGFVYHATSWRFAEDILNNGIWLDQCRRSRDFGRRPSFYVSKSFRTAIEWVKKKRRLYSRQNAIIVYHLTQEMAERAGCSWKVLDGDTQEWRTVVFESRHGRRCGVDGFDFVEGPYLRKPPPSSTVADECSPSDHPHLQIACKSERGVGFLEGNLVGVVYLPQDDIGDTLLKNWL
ncbi:hypothetical protein BKA69DRAFT_1102844 [Paraphysoderma sedebokerense]|nr:hypothetical protein BKA69DRAFT_1102844 [Paraphysoderma sedebokerense]